MSTTELIVPLDLAPAPYVLANSGFLATLAKVEEQAAALTVTDADSAQAAAELQIRLTNAGKELERQRVELARPFLDAQRKIADAARGPAGRIETTKNLLKKQLADYDAEQRRKAAEAEKARQAEIRRLDALRQAEIDKEVARLKEVERLAAEARASLPPEEVGECLDEDDPTPPPKTEVQRQLEAVQHAPVVAEPKPSGIVFKTTLVAIVEDAAKLPDQFVERVPKLQAIRALYCVGWQEGKAIPVVPGCRFEVKRDAVSSGRRF